MKVAQEVDLAGFDRLEAVLGRHDDIFDFDLAADFLLHRRRHFAAEIHHITRWLAAVGFIGVGRGIGAIADLEHAGFADLVQGAGIGAGAYEQRAAASQ